MQQHRNLCRQYAEAYRTKLLSKKVAADIQKLCDEGEEKINLFNLFLIRQRVDLEVNIISGRAGISADWLTDC